MTSEEARRRIEDAHQVLRADYWQDVREAAEELKDRLQAGEFGDREEFQDALHETVDGHQRVIFTFEAQQCLLYSDNDGAYFEDFGSEGVVKDGQINWSALAYAAFERDIIEHLDAIDVDVNDPIPAREDEE
jgi:hypothetical protein